jgi:hypothetical protein
MVPVIRVSNAFHARVIAARLGSDGIVTQLRGGVDSPYPMGDVEVLVSEADLDEAAALLLADEIESAFDEDGDEGGATSRSHLPTWARLLIIGGLVLIVWVDALAYR